jgi:hypothetical protein
MRQERDERADRRFERALSAAGAGGLLALALLGPTGIAVAILVFAVVVAVVVAVIVAVVGAPPWTRGRRTIPLGAVPDDRWGIWRRVEPDPEFLRAGRRRQRAA